MVNEIIDSEYKTGGEPEKRKTWSAWAIKHLGEMKLAKVAGLFPKKEGWRNVVEHSLVVNAAAVYLAKNMADAGYSIDIGVVDKASILHDIGKRKDKERGVKRAEEHDVGVTKELLQSAAYSIKIINAAEYSGRVPEIYLPKEEQGYAISGKPIEDLIVAYADARVRNTNIVPLAEARDKNKEKIPTDAEFYDNWYAFYKKVEDRIFSLTELSPQDLNEQNVFEMVKNTSSNQIHSL